GDPATRVFVSAASAWEIVIKYKIGRLSLPGPPEDWFEGEQARNGFEGLPPASRTPLRQAHCQSIIATRLTEC
ncbi:MAG: hypothetical protein VW835_02105, partial [Rickettsiales bacterium]